MKNTEIKTSEVKLVNSETHSVEVISTEEALRIAEEQGLDLICLDDKGDIPVVKIGDYNKLLFDKKKKEKENKKKQRELAQDIKEVRITDCIAEHDILVKAKNIDKFLKNGDKVLISIRYKGRTVKLIGNGEARIKSLLDKVTEEFEFSKPIAITGNQVSAIITPNSKKKKGENRK